jgi:hypothetical protein
MGRKLSNFIRKANPKVKKVQVLDQKFIVS